MTSCSHGAWPAASGWGAALWRGLGPAERTASAAGIKLNTETRRGVAVGKGFVGGKDVTGRTIRGVKGWRAGSAQSGEGNKQEREGGKDGGQSSRNLGEDRDQPFSFTVGDPGSLWGGITCRRVDRRNRITGLIRGIYTLWATNVLQTL